jgi:hypothetical protein
MFREDRIPVVWSLVRAFTFDDRHTRRFMMRICAILVPDQERTTLAANDDRVGEYWCLHTTGISEGLARRRSPIHLSIHAFTHRRKSIVL